MILEFFSTNFTYVLSNIGIIAALVFLYLLIRDNIRGDLPPGPFCFPIIGNMIQVLLADPVPFVSIHKLSKKYGDIMRLRVGLVESIIISSYEAMKDVFSRDELINRPYNAALEDRTNGARTLGLLWSDGEHYKENKQFTLQFLRQFGFGDKEAQHALVKGEIGELFEKIKFSISESNNNSTQIHVFNFFTSGLLNLVSSIVTGERLPQDDPDLKKLANASYKFLKNGHVGVGLITAWPFLRKLFPNWLGYNEQMEAIQEKNEFAKKLLADHRASGLYKTVPKCFTDLFLQKIDETKNDPNSIYTEEHFCVIFSDFVIGASYTQDAYLSFAILLLSLQPDIQEKVHKEIVNKFGQDELSPDTSGRSKMPYTLAVMTELHRWARIGVSIPLSPSKDVYYKGYKIPKGVYVVGSLHSIFFDEEFWGDPENFRPERYFTENGSLDKQKLDRVIAFGAGKRQCYGEAVAQDTTFLYFCNLFQQFRFQIPPGENPSTQPLLGVALRPEPFNAIVTLR